MFSVPARCAVRNRSPSTPKTSRPDWFLRGLRPCGPGIKFLGNGSADGPLTIRIDGGRICRIGKK